MVNYGEPFFNAGYMYEPYGPGPIPAYGPACYGSPPRYGSGFGAALVVVVVILLIILGAAYFYNS